MKKLLTFILIFALGITVGVIVTHYPTPSISPAFYKTEAYFSPDGGVSNHIINAINKADGSIDLAIFDLTSQDIKTSLEKAKQRGVKIRITADSRQAKGVHSVIQTLINEGFNVRIVHGIGRGIMHNKFAIFDGKLLVTGSYNWTNNAEHNNYENAVFIIDPNAIKQYQKEFNAVYGQ